MKISLVVAVSDNNAIGRGGDLLWRLPKDMQFFKTVTMGHHVLMGRKTYESIPPKFRPLPGRRNIVLTRNPSFLASGAEIAADFQQALTMVADAPKVFVMGGAQIYAQALPLADELILTEIDRSYPADAWFPVWDVKAFVEVERKTHLTAESEPVKYSFVTYRRKTV